MNDRYTNTMTGVAQGFTGQINTVPVGYQDAKSAQPTRLDAAADHLGKMQASFSDLNARLSRVADRLAGMVPEPVEKNSTTGGPTCTAHRMELIIEDFGATLRRMDSTVSRIEAL